MPMEESQSVTIDYISVAAAASSIQLQDEEKEAHDYIMDFVKSTRRDQDSKMKFLASIDMLCRASVQGRYQSPTSHELLSKLEALMQNETFDSMDTMMWQQALLAIAALSKYRESVLYNHLCKYIGDTFSFVASETISQCTPFYDQILKTLDSVLEALIHGASQKSCIFITEKILQVLLPITASEDVAKRRKAVGWIVRLTYFLSSSSMLEHFNAEYGMRRFSRNKPLDFLGHAVGYLALSCAEEDQEISCGAFQALCNFKRFLLVRQSYCAKREDTEMPLEREVVNSLWPMELNDEMAEPGNFLLPSERYNVVLTVLSNMTQERVSNTQVIANTLKTALMCLKLTKVDDYMQIIYRQLMLVTRRSLWDILMQTLLQMAQLHSWDVTTSLLSISITGDIDMALQLQANPRTSENCQDKTCYGQDGPTDSDLWHRTTTGAMWNALACEPSISGRILKSLVLIQHTSMLQSNFRTNCNCHVLLTITNVMRMAFLVPSNQSNIRKHLEELFMALVLQISFTTKSPQEGCCCSKILNKEAEDRVVNRRRCVVRTMQAFFHFLGGDSLVEDIKGEGAWDMLMSPYDYPSGIRVLSRVLKHKERASCTSICEEAVGIIRSHEDICAIIVCIELLDCTRLKIDDSLILYVLHMRLRSESSVLRKVAITSLATLSEKPKQAKAMSLQGLLPAVMQQLQDDDCDVMKAALTVLSNILCVVDRQTAGPIALQLLNMLLPLFENASSCVRKQSILLSRDVMRVSFRSHKKQMRKDVHRSLLPLFFHLHDSDSSVAQASKEAVVEAAKFLRWQQLQKLLQTEQIWGAAKCMLKRSRRRLEEYLHQSLLYQQSPQEPLREAAVRFIGLAGQHLKDGRKEKILVINEALQNMENDSSPLVSSLVLKTKQMLYDACEEPSSRSFLAALWCCLRRAERRRIPNQLV
ncbi:maestro heat-like repeat-containing protein family member 6 isoform X3 [Melopsittacus undulatus]|uniref:maestro heat-like repeat-containing protein family member 6 isoform X3 n=1 Tax=Melopsittacus undulatus TaxID=13146 RepID=UPI00146F5F06|nr:maestro heat-like repeat-containing protein family member 6 isoform X3 [Melopsittacus undulatus]